MTSNTPDVSERLTHMFAYWQTCALFYESIVRGSVAGKAPPTALKTMDMAHRLIPTIMDQSVESISMDDWNPAPECINETILNPINFLGDEYAHFPLELFEWNRKSRRVFHLPHTLVAALSAATFGDVTWSEMTLPYNSFIITLERPFQVCSYGEVMEKYDTILVSKLPIQMDGRSALSIRLVQAPKNPGVRLGLTQSQLNRYLTLLKRKRWDKAASLCEDILLNMFNEYPTAPGSCGFLVFLYEDGTTLIQEDLDTAYVMAASSENNYENAQPFSEAEISSVKKHKLEISQVALRIVIGWSLYLENLSPERVTPIPNTRSAKRLGGGNSGIITNPTEVFHIAAKSRMANRSGTHHRHSVEEGGFVRPHWRRAHKKRPAGSPSDALKTIKMPRTLVREDLVPLFGIIGGTETVVFLDD